MQFVIYCLDDPATPDVRPTNRDRHLEYVAQVGASIKVAGPVTDDDGTSIGSLFIVDVADRAAAQALSDADPNAQAGVFKSVDIRQFKWLITDGKRV